MQRTTSSPVRERPVVDGIVIDRELGYGGFATVWSGVRTADEAAIALKVSHLAGRASSAEMAIEARAMAAVGPPAAPVLYDSGVLEDGRPFLTMEHIAGITWTRLHEALHGSEHRDGRPGLSAVLDVCLALLRSLDVVHTNGRVHLDLKPSNVMLTDGDEVLRGQRPRRCVLIDFGLSQSESATQPAEFELGEGSSTVIGSVEYIAPERLTRRGLVDRRADIYSFGVMLYELLTGRVPFQGDRESVTRGHAILRPPRPSAFADVPGPVEAVCLACLAKRPEDRPANVGALSRRLAHAFQEASGPVRQHAELRSAEPTGDMVAAGRQPVVLLVVPAVSSISTMMTVLRAHGGFVARRRGAMVVCAFSALATHAPWRAALAAARDLLEVGVNGVALHVTGARVRRGSPPRARGRDISRPERWLPSAPWSGIVISRALASALPEGLAERVSAPIDGEPAGADGAGADHTRGRTKRRDWYQPVTTDEPSADDTPLVGRDATLREARASLRTCLAQAAPALCTFIGEPGMGKSRLSVELARMSAAEAPDTSPLLIRASRALPGQADPTLVALAREIARVTGDTVSVPPEPDAALVYRLGEGLRRAAGLSPLVIIIDDCHRASETVLSLVEYVVLDGENGRADRFYTGVSLWIAVTVDPVLLRRRPHWGQHGERHLHVELPPLSLADASSLAATLLLPAEYPPRALREQLAEASAGNPFLLTELCRKLVRQGMIRRGSQPGSYYVASEAQHALPALSAGTWLASRQLALLPEPLAALARMCAVLGSEFARDEVVHVVADAERTRAASTPLDIDVGLAILQQRGLLTEVTGGQQGKRRAQGVWAFVKPMFQDAIYRQVQAADRRSIHNSALAYWRARLDSLSGVAYERALEAVARHAEALGEPTAVDAYLKLAERAHSRHRDAEADWNYTRALRLTGGDNDRTFRALRGRGVVRYRLHRIPDSIEDLRRASEISVTSNVRTEQIEVWLDLSTSLDWAGKFGESGDYVARVAQHLDPHGDDALRARYLAALGRTQYRRNQPDEAIQTLTRAHRLLQSSEDTEWTVISLVLLGTLLAFTGRVAEAEARFAEMVNLCERHGDRFHLCVAFLNRAWLWLARKDSISFERALVDLYSARRIARRAGQPILERGASHNIAELLHGAGRHELALRHALRALALQRFLPEPVTTDFLLVARIYAAMGRMSETKDYTERMRTLTTDSSELVPPGETVLLQALSWLACDDALAERDWHARWDQLLAGAPATMLPEEALELCFLRGLHARRTGDVDALQAMVSRIRDRLSEAPHCAGLVAPLLEQPEHTTSD